MSDERGEIKKITLDIEYPDGTTKELVMDPVKEGIEGIAWNKKILKTVYDSDLSCGKFPEIWDAEDWKDRPTLAVFYTPLETKDKKDEPRPTHRCILRACPPA